METWEHEAGPIIEGSCSNGCDDDACDCEPLDEQRRRLPMTDPLRVPAEAVADAMIRHANPSDLGKCRARTEDPPHYLHTYPCTRTAKTLRGGMALCTQHAKMVDRVGSFLVHDWRREARA